MTIGPNLPGGITVRDDALLPIHKRPLLLDVSAETGNLTLGVLVVRLDTVADHASAEPCRGRIAAPGPLRTRTHQRHVAAEDVPQLRQLIWARAARKYPTLVTRSSTDIALAVQVGTRVQ